MIEDINKYDKYRQTDPTVSDLAQKAKDLHLVDGLPFTYCICDKPAYGSSTVALDLRRLEADYHRIYEFCEHLSLHSPVIDVPFYKPHAFRPERKSGLTRLTKTLCDQLDFIHGAVIAIEHSCNHDHQSTMQSLLQLENSREKMRLMNDLSTLTHDFRRNYFSDIPFLLEIVASDKDADFYLFNHTGSFDDQDMVSEEQTSLLATENHPFGQAIRDNTSERERLRANGADLLKEVDVVLAEAKQVTVDPVLDYFKDSLPPAAAAAAAAKTTKLINGLKAVQAKTDSSLQSLRNDSKNVKPDKQADRRTAESTVSVKTGAGINFQPEDFDNSFTKTRKMFKSTTGIEPTEISVKFPGGFATSTF